MNKRTRKKGISFWGIFFPFCAIFLAIWFLITSSAYEETWTFDLSEIDTELRDSVLQLQKHREIYPKETIEGEINPRYKTRKWIIRNASIEELHILKKYPSGVVKAIAFETLIHKEKGHQYDLFLESLEDTTHFFEYNRGGCIGYTVMPGEYLFREYFWAYEFDLEPDTFLLNRFQLNIEQFRNIQAIYRKRKSKKREYLEEFYF